MEIKNKLGSKLAKNAKKYYAAVNKAGEDVMRDYSIDAIRNEILKSDEDYTIEWRPIPTK